MNLAAGSLTTAAAVAAPVIVAAAIVPTAVIAAAEPHDDQKDDDPAAVTAAPVVVAHNKNLLREVVGRSIDLTFHTMWQGGKGAGNFKTDRCLPWPWPFSTPLR